MQEKVEHEIDPGFTPDIFEYTNGGNHDQLKAWGIEPYAVPLGSTNNRDVALWHGTVNYKSGTPVIAVSVDSDFRKNKSISGHYPHGIPFAPTSHRINTDTEYSNQRNFSLHIGMFDLETFEKILNEDKIEAYYYLLDQAEYYSSTPDSAINTLVSMFPELEPRHV